MNTLQIIKGYNTEAFLKDIGKILKKSGGVTENGVSDKKQAFLFSDTQIIQESFLEDINFLRFLPFFIPKWKKN